MNQPNRSDVGVVVELGSSSFVSRPSSFVSMPNHQRNQRRSDGATFGPEVCITAACQRQYSCTSMEWAWMSKEGQQGVSA